MVPLRVAVASFGPHITVQVAPQFVTVQPVAGHCTAQVVAVAQSTVVVDEVCACTLHVSLAAQVTSQVSPAAHWVEHTVPPPTQSCTHALSLGH
ncbi:MAG: hypothetical protein QM831_30060 [Kofleriaceae bacterium]